MNDEVAGGSACLLQKRKISIVMNFVCFCCLVVQREQFPSDLLAHINSSQFLSREISPRQAVFSIRLGLILLLRQGKKSMPLLDTSIKELFLILGRWVKHELKQRDSY